jgi:hypothetical protein
LFAELQNKVPACEQAEVAFFFQKWRLAEWSSPAMQFPEKKIISSGNPILRM